MEFLKSAVASIAKGPAFPYTFGERVDIDQSIWSLCNGTKREDGSKCSIFSFDVTANRSRLPLAKNALRKFKTLRHPGIVKVLDTAETDQVIYIATERVTPLNWVTRRKALSEESLKWGLHNVAKTLKFINDEASSVHGNVRASSIFTSESGEWKLGGLEILSSIKEDDAVIFTQGSVVPDIGRYSPPEVIKNGWANLRQAPTHAVDAYDYGILVTEVFNGGFTGSDQVESTKSIPPLMQTQYKRLTHAMPKMRLSVAHFLEQGLRPGAFFDTPLIQLSNGVDNLGLKNESERDEFLTELGSVTESDDFPEDFFKVKILPELLKSVEFGGGGPKSLALAMRVATKLNDEEFDQNITPVVVRLFTSTDRAIRVCLLDNLPLMIDHFGQRLVSDKIFPQMVTGFGDLAPVVREQTVKAVLVVAPKLSDRVLNGELLRHLAKTANDEQPGIRTNTTICLGKIARNLGAGSRAKVLSAAFSRALRDPFVHARNAALLALAATVDIFTEEDCATKMLPAICPSLVDKEKMIRDQANKTLSIYLERVRRYSATLPDTILPPSGTTSADITCVSSPVPSSAAGTQASSQWVGWAISSFTNKLSSATGEIQSDATTSRPGIERSSSTPANGVSDRATPSLHTTPSVPVVPKVSSQLNVSSTVEDEDFGADAWGEMDEEATDNADDPWAEPTGTATRTATKPHVAYDDGGEPDFEGWLNAQAQAKVGGKKPLPKGLARKVTPTSTLASKPASLAVRSTSATSVRNGGVTTGSAAPRAAPKAAVVKPATTTSATTKTTQDDDEDWGDAWT